LNTASVSASSGESAEANYRAVPPAGVARTFAQFVRSNTARIVFVSAVVLIPCVWHRRIIASDLGSHLYNAWLVQLIRAHSVPGLYLAHQHTNVLFDYLLDALGRVLTLYHAETVAVGLCVLAFFWGMFALAAAAAKRAPWCLAPALAIFTYGYTFHMGFFNYYLSLAFAFWGIAIAWRARSAGDLALILPFAALAAVAHPLGLAWLVAGAIYVFVAARLPTRWHIALVAVAIVALAGVHHYVWHHNIVEEQMLPFFNFTGADQFVLFSERYKWIEDAFLAFSALAIGRDLWANRSKNPARHNYAIPAELYVILLVAVALLPEGIRFADQVPALALLTGRLTSVSAALLCCLLAAMRPRRWHFAGFLALAAVYFTFVYRDTGVINRMESQVEQLLHTLPPDQRVMGSIPPLDGSRILIQHMLDRSCIGHCFSYGNYEAAAKLFRVRGTPGNPYAMTDFDSTADMEEGVYQVQDEDLPAYGVYVCDPDDGTKLCIRALKSGELVDPHASLPPPDSP
jgi:hypothetical protein